MTYGSTDSPLLHIALMMCGVFLLFGITERFVACVTCALAVLIAVQSPTGFETAAMIHVGLLVVQALVPPRAFGSWSARGRVDPRGDWRLPRALFFALWLATWGVLVARLASDFTGEGTDWSIGKWPFVAALVLTVAPQTRFVGWLVGAASVIGWIVAERVDPTTGLGCVLLLYLFDPAWIAPIAQPSSRLVFYDGTCGLCHSTTRFLLSEDRDQRLRFAPLQGPTFKAERNSLETESLPDSLIIFDEKRGMLARSDAIVASLQQLGGAWRPIGGILSLVPRVLRDSAYDFVARIRHRIFTKPAAFCPLLPEDLEARFLP